MLRTRSDSIETHSYADQSLIVLLLTQFGFLNWLGLASLITIRWNQDNTLNVEIFTAPCHVVASLRFGAALDLRFQECPLSKLERYSRYPVS